MDNKRKSGAVFNNGDYEKDGILYCGKCGEAKEFVWSFGGKKRIVKALCNCDLAEKAEAEKAREEAERQKEIAIARRAGFPDKELLKYTFSNNIKKFSRTSNAMERYAKDFDYFKEMGKGLLLYGPVESGKTFYACCIANALIDKGYTCLATNFSRIANTLWDTPNRQAYYDSLNKFDLLVIDDLGAERETDYMEEIIFNIVDNRDRAGLPMIITTNLTLEEIKGPTDVAKQRIYSRILKNCFPVEIAGDKYRIALIKRDYDEIKERLGL